MHPTSPRPDRERPAEGVRAGDRLAAELGHELRGRLTTLLTAASMLEQYRRHLPPAGQEVLGLLREEADRFQRLLTDLLDIARADAGAEDDVVSDVPVVAAVRAVLGRHTDRPVDELLFVADGAHDVHVRGDRRRFDRVLDNLLDNADRHGGGLTGVRVECGDATVWLVVDDAGPGVPEADRDRIFDRFVRGAGSEGAGLGLTLAARHVQRMRGTLTVGDSPSLGARFVVTLPAVRPPPG